MVADLEVVLHHKKLGKGTEACQALYKAAESCWLAHFLEPLLGLARMPIFWVPGDPPYVSNWISGIDALNGLSPVVRVRHMC